MEAGHRDSVISVRRGSTADENGRRSSISMFINQQLLYISQGQNVGTRIPFSFMPSMVKHSGAEMGQPLWEPYTYKLMISLT